VHIERDATCGTDAGWTFPCNRPLLLLLTSSRGAAAEQAVTQLIRSGYNTLEGSVTGGLEAWQAEE
jgi:hypothetical protein